MIIFVCISFVNNPVVIAQKVSFSEAIEVLSNDNYRLIGQFDDEILIFIDNRKEYKVVSMNKELKIQWEEILDIEPRDYRVSGLIAQDTTFSLFLSQVNRDSSFLYHLEYNSRGKINKEFIIDRSRKRQRVGAYLFTHSEDENQVVFLQTNRYNYIRVFSYNVQNYKLNFEEELIFEESLNDEFRILDIDNKGDVVIILDRFNNKFRSGKHHLKLINIKGKSASSIYDIPQNDLLFTDINSTIDNTYNKIYIAGFYSSNSYHDSDGYFITQFDLNDGSFKTDYHQWDISLLAEVRENDMRRKRTLSDLNLVSIELYEDGGILLMCEEQKVLQRRNSLNNSRGFSTGDYVDYYYEDIILISKFDDPQKNWTKVIRKRQFSQDDRASFSSFFVFKVPSYLNVMFNDEISSNSIVSGFLVKGNGQMKRTSILSTDYHNLRLKMNDALQLSSNQVLIPSEYRSVLRFVLVEF